MAGVMSPPPVILEEVSAIVLQNKSCNKIRNIRLQKRLTDRDFSLSHLFFTATSQPHSLQ